MRFAVADGATESSFSSLWAKLLVRAYGNGRLKSRDSLGNLAPLQKFWDLAVDAKPLPWYAEQKAKDGAFASLAGITLCDRVAEGPLGSWHGFAVGDSCVVQMKGEQPRVRFPYHESAQFNSRPLLLGSDPSANGRVAEAAVVLENESWEEGDQFFLMTDALACWFMREFEQGAFPWKILDEIIWQTEFADWFQQSRDAKVLKNDDVTLVRLTPFW